MQLSGNTVKVEMTGTLGTEIKSKKKNPAAHIRAFDSIRCGLHIEPAVPAGAIIGLTVRIVGTATNHGVH